MPTHRQPTGLIVSASVAALAAACGAAAWTIHGPLSVMLAGGGALVAGVCAGGLVAVHRRTVKRLDAVSRDMAELSLELARHEMFSRAQNSLDKNLRLLREALYIHGEPRRVGDTLFFGDRRINDDFTAVDLVRQQAGGTATIFLGDRRISTNVMKPDGTRAVGTQLAQGPVYDCVLGRKEGFRGEAEILGESYFTLYEPLIADGEVIGVLYVGVKKADFAARLQELESTVHAHADATSAISGAVDTFRQAATAQASAEHEAIDGRQSSENIRRQHEIARQTAARDQREVVRELSAALERLSAGDLSQPIAAPFPAEYEKLKTDFNAALRSVRETMRGINEGCGAIRHGADEICQAADDLARRTERQAASLEETAAALDEITATVKKSAEGADEAGRLVAAARGNAERGGTVMADAVAAMSRIQDSSHQIGQIIGAIDEIAFQTNLLALNAGVEAARAGEAGKGFAVVASEVRALAQRSAEAAKQIKTLIAASTHEVETGSAVVSETETVLGQIVSEVVAIDRVVREIAGSAREQAHALDQVNTAINEMDQVTQQNAAMVEESTAASHNLAREVAQVSESVGRFRIDEEPVGGARGLLGKLRQSFAA